MIRDIKYRRRSERTGGMDWFGAMMAYALEITLGRDGDWKREENAIVREERRSTCILRREKAEQRKSSRPPPALAVNASSSLRS